MSSYQSQGASQKLAANMSDNGGSGGAGASMLASKDGSASSSASTALADVEIVAFGPGLRLLFEGNSNTGRIQGLVDQGVRFFACQNTINNMSSTLGEPLKLNPNHTTGKGGIVRIKELVDQGYMLAKP